MVFTSKALEVNLAKTQYDKNVLPEGHQWFLSLSGTYMGIHKYAEELVHEYNHSYINYDFCIESLHNVSITNLWFYSSHIESERALKVITGIYVSLMGQPLNEKTSEKLRVTFLKFISRLSKEDKIHQDLIEHCLSILEDDIKVNEMTYIRNSNCLKIYLSDAAAFPEFENKVCHIHKYILLKCVHFWSSITDIENWYSQRKDLIHPSYYHKIAADCKALFQRLEEGIENAVQWEEIKFLMFYNDIAEYLRKYCDRLEKSVDKIYYLFYLLNHPGMFRLKNYLLYDICRLFKYVISELDCQKTEVFLYNMMDLLLEVKGSHMETVLDCILALGREIINSEDANLISCFINRLISFGFVHPGKMTVSSDWQIVVDSCHIKNIRVWMELFEYCPSKLSELLPALIVHLKLGGIFISDTDLFQRDVTRLLNSDISPVFKQIKQLARIFPVYFKDIGAEGRLREVTTSLDELSHRQDLLIHFLRKQIHTESNNTHVELSKKILQFWYDGNLDPLRKLLPSDVISSIDIRGKWFTGVHKVVTELCSMKNIKPVKLLGFKMEELETTLSKVNDVDEKDLMRVSYLVELHYLILEKYSLESGNIVHELECCRFFNSRDIANFKSFFYKNDARKALLIIYKFMGSLKQVILSGERSEPLENIYYKRHIAFGIPSMYGQYMEPKFESLGLLFRLEKVASRLMEQVVQSVNMKYITAKTLNNIYRILKLFKEGLELDGIENQGFSSNLQMLKYGLSSPNFSFDQYINIFKFMEQNIKEIINEYFLRIYDRPLKTIIPQFYKPEEAHAEAVIRQVVQIQSEIFYRDILSSAFLIQQLDDFIANITTALHNMSDNYSDAFIKKIMTYNPDLIISPLYRETMETDNPVFIGAKAFYLKKLTSYGFPVPPGFVLTTEFFSHKNTVLNHPYINQELDNMIQNNIRKLEKMSGLKFGDSKRPLLLSVRSGTAISMPGAMSTFLNIGLNDEIVEGFSRQADMSWTAWDCYRRLIQSWSMSSGVDRDIFDRIIIDFKTRYGFEQKVQFTAEQMKKIAYAYKEVLKDHGMYIESNPYIQLKQAIINVIDSWSSSRTKSFREHLQIANEWGTAVIVQKMVLGNISSSSGTGVVFTHNPNYNSPGVNLYGDFTLRSQGEDIVAGLVHTLPITESQRKEYYRDCATSLEQLFPEIYKRLLSLSTQLIEKHGFNHQEIEFTFESARPEGLYILQTRDQKIQDQKKVPIFSIPSEEMKLVGRGIGIGGGALCGILSFNMEDLQNHIKIYPGKKHIVVRPDTVPDDIPMAFICDGLITCRGGATSHAAVTASSLGKVCIVNCRDLYVNELKKECIIGGITFKSGDTISIDGTHGSIFAGSYPVEYL